MLCGMCFQHRTVYHGFRYVIGNEFCPDLLFDVLWFIGMKIAQPYRVFQLSERGFDAPSCIVKFLDMFSGVSLLAFEVYAFYIKSVARSFYSQLLLLWIPMRTKFPLCFLSAFFLMLFLIPFI